MLLHKAVKNNPVLHIINFKVKMLLAGCMHTACICLLDGFCQQKMCLVMKCCFFRIP